MFAATTTAAATTSTCGGTCNTGYADCDKSKWSGCETELATDDWLRVLREARALGAVQCGFSGGEPLQRADLESLVGEARRLGYYTNLLTSGIGFNEVRAAALSEDPRPLFDGLARHTQEGLDFVARAGELGFREAVRRRDDPFGDYGSGPKSRRRRPR